MSDKFFAGEYETVETLKDDPCTAVYIVRHKTLGSLRVMKLIKKREDMERLRFEASLLDSLRHPGIPVLYDYGETEDFVFLIEEYVKGEPLNEYVLTHTLSETQIVRYIIELSDILIYLHTGCTPAVLYQDMKPEHIFIHGDSLKLVDYGICRFISGGSPGMTRADRSYGTIRYASPEQIAGAPADERSDLYSLARVVKELSVHCERKVSRQFLRLLVPALSENPKKRPISVKEWKDKWLCLQEKLSKEKKTGGHYCGTVSVVGNESGAGTTHIAVSLCAYLNRLHFGSALYEDMSGGNTVYRMAQNSPAFLKQGNQIYHNGFKGFIPDRTEENSFIHGSPYGLTVRDCGTDISLSTYSDLTILVAGGALWKSRDLAFHIIGSGTSGNFAYILNNGNVGTALKLSRRLEEKLFIFPADKDPFAVTRKKRRLFNRLLREGGLEWVR